MPASKKKPIEEPTETHTACINLEYPHDGRRKATIVTNDKELCAMLASDPDIKLKVVVDDGSEPKIKVKEEQFRPQITHKVHVVGGPPEGLPPEIQNMIGMIQEKIEGTIERHADDTVHGYYAMNAATWHTIKANMVRDMLLATSKTQVIDAWFQKLGPEDRAKVYAYAKALEIYQNMRGE